MRAAAPPGSTIRSHNVIRLCATIAAAVLALAVCPAIAALPQPGLACEQASHDAAAAAGLPPGLLLAIGRVESGRASATLGRVTPWPWTLDFAGSGAQFATGAEALAALQAALAAGQTNIDVGCFQVNLGAHPHAFTDLQTALDPVANAQFAAGFLGRLHARLGTWPAAAAAYHSETAALGEPYLMAVMRNWASHAGPDAEPSHAPDRTWVLITPVRGLQIIAPGSTVLADADTMHIITPTSTPSAAGPRIRYGALPPLPR
ncbi:MAG: transglycosylase SLT domain-containing protein [Acetobacteraceae bacterium]